MSYRKSSSHRVAALGILILAITSGAQTRLAKREKTSPEQKKGPEVRFSPQVINDPVTAEKVIDGSVGPAVVRAQILLDRAHFSPGEIDGHYGENLSTAIKGYQASRGLAVTGEVDEATWRALNADTGPALVPYEITAADIAGPYAQIPTGLMEQSQLQTLGFQSEGEALGERFHAQPKLLEEMNADKDFARAGESILVPNVQRSDQAAHADRIVVSKNGKVLQALAPDGKVLAQYPATMGSEHDPLPLGSWRITVIQHNPIFYYNPDLFWNSDPKDSKAKIAPGPNNPVGVVWIGISRAHYGIHGTPEPGTIGHIESHGCIRLTNWDAEELSKMVNDGTPAILQE
jgi:lipoprotein-anchoring transpeptidase ErfK/SrfK